jgi:hypothetical protein
MTSPREVPADDTEPTPNFELPRYGVIREDNWPEYQARGFVPVGTSDGSPRSLAWPQACYGIGHVYTGDAFDYAEQRPLRHKPGVGIYTEPDGLVYRDEWQHEMEEWLRHRERRQGESGGGPGNS